MYGEHPTFTIIVPTRNRPGHVEQVLRCLQVLVYPPDRFEVLVVDDGSEPPVSCGAPPSSDAPKVVLIKQQPAGPAAARNRGATAASGEFLAFTDDDCRPAPDWLARLADRLTRTPDRAVGGCTVNGLPQNLCSIASQMLISHLYAYYNRDAENARFLTTNNLALSARLFRDVGGLDTTYIRAAAEDRELCDRWLHHGLGLTYAPEAVVYHEHALTAAGFWQQHFGYGRGAWRYRLARAARERGPVRIEPARFYADLLGRPFATEPIARATTLTALLLLSQAANAAGFFWERWAGGSARNR